MKNIHILPTDKPSNIGYYTDIKDTRLYILSNGNKIGNYKNNWNPQNIYITSDEEIKDCNCYVINAVGVLDKMNVFKPIKVTEEIVRKEPLITYPNGGWCKKIILTTDEDLIKDGVQAIDDTFLEWFVKNPSCEEVKISPYHVVPSYLMGNEKPIIGYKIIIPKEEPKQETLEEVAEKTKGKELFKKSNDRARKLLSEIELLPIAETLEEYIERETKSIIEPSLRAAAIAFLRYGAKWQAEKDKNKFSEEEMKNTIQIVFELTNKGYSVDEIFEQLKNKL